MKQLILGTAGHIDHGKTTLVKALTGIDTDRLKEEKARGITIELGFAFLDLPSGQRLGIVDVPGHERFVRHMVAGAAGVDLVALIIAADEGVMPQTREHLDICKLLAVRAGLVVLTKADLVEPDWLEMVREEVAEFVGGSFLAGAPILAVSATTGQGLPELVAALDQLARGLGERPAAGPFRLPVDRIFTIKGFGTVATGTALSGELVAGQEVTIYPRGLAAKVRGLQVHGQEVASARRGQRVAINLQGVDKDDLGRGEVVAARDALSPSLWLDLALETLPGLPRPLKHRAPVRLHTGTAEALGRVLLLDRDQLGPGEKALCQVRLEAPVAVMAGDRFVLRSYSPVTTIAGGWVIHPHSRRHKRHRPEVLADLVRLSEGSPRERLAIFARQAGLGGVAAADLPRLVPQTRKEQEALFAEMLSQKELIRYDKEAGLCLARPVWEELLARALALVADFHRQNPLKAGMPREELRQRLAGKGPAIPAKLFGQAVARLAEEGRLAAEKDLLRLPGHRVRLAGEEEALKERILQALRAGGSAPPSLKEAFAGEDPALLRQLVKVLVERGEIVKVKEDIYYLAPVLAGLRDQLVQALKAEARISAARFKELTGLSRKYLIALLEYFDATQVTMRLGDERVLRKG